jgi:DNA-binding MarR family transcriptional regulator
MSANLSADYLDVVPKAMISVRVEMRRCRDSDLSLAQFRILAHLYHGASTNKQLAENIGVSVGAMSRMVRGLAERHLISRIISHSDRREIQLGLTKKGIHLFEAIRNKARLGISKRIAILSEADRKTLRQGLKVLQKITIS